MATDLSQTGTEISDLGLVSQILQNGLRRQEILQLLQSRHSGNQEELLERMADILGKIAALLEVANRVSDTLSLDTLLQRMMEITASALRVERSTLFLHDAEHQELYARALVAQSGVDEIRFAHHLGIAGAVFTTGQPVIIPDAYADPRFNREVDRKTNYHTRNILCAPIRTRDNTIIGVTQLLNKTDGDFTVDDLTLVAAITSQASAALQNAQLFEQVQRAHEQETQLLEVTTAMSTELQLQPLLARIMETTTAILDADRTTLFMYDERAHELWSQVAQGEESRQIRFPAHLGIAGSVFSTRETVNIPDAYADPRFNQALDRTTGYRTHSILCMPVINKEGKAIGVIQVLNKKGGPFTRVDEKRLQAFAAQASVALENAQLFEDVLNIKNYNESILQSLSNGVITLDAEQHIVKCNAAALRILEEEVEDIEGRSVADYFSGANSWITASVHRMLFKGTADLTLDTEILLPRGKMVSVNLTTVPLRNVRKELIGSMLIFENITEEKRVRSTMARYMTKEVAEKLLESTEDKLGGQVQEASILFSDIRNFTSISEKMGAHETVLMLNEYFSLMVDIIFQYGGILDKYIGDAIMAVFGAPFSSGEDADHAVKTAIDMMRALYKFNQQRLVQGKEGIDIGIGISTDEVVSGNIGSLKRMEYTVIGDGVNLASRLEGANKYYGSRILISEFTFHDLKGTYLTREVDIIRVKGKTRPVSIYEILDFHDTTTFPWLHKVLIYYQQGLQAYRQRNWQKSLEHFQEALYFQKDDGPSRLYMDRCHYFLRHPPADHWDGVWAMESK